MLNDRVYPTRVASFCVFFRIEYMCHCYLRQDGLGAVIVTDKEYPARVAFNLETKLLDDFDTKYMYFFVMSSCANLQGSLEEREGGQPIPCSHPGEDAAGLSRSSEMR